MKVFWNQLNASTWRLALPDCACAMQQSWTYGSTIKAMGGQVERAEIFDADQRIGLAQLVQRRVMGVATASLVSRGPIWLQDVAKQKRQAGIVALRTSITAPGLKPLLVTQDADEHLGMPLYSSCCVAELDLTCDLKGLHRNLHVKWRNALTRARNSGVRIETSNDPDLLVTLIEKEQAQQRAKRYRNLPGQFFANWVRVDPYGFRMYRAHMGSECISEMLFLLHKPGASYHIGWTTGAGRTFNAHHLLIWQAMQDFAREGIRRLDLGTLDTVNAPGLARFKLGTGAKMRRLGQTSLVLPRLRWGRAA